MARPKYQIFPPLRPEELRALEADIAKRGVQVPVEVDEEGNILDGHHRAQIAERIKLPCETIVRKGWTEQQKREHVIKLNLARRHLDPVRWGQAFKLLCEQRGVQLASGARNELTSATVAEVAEELGVPARTARHRVTQANAYEALPEVERRAVDNDEIALTEARCRVRKADIPRRVAQIPEGKYRVLYADPPWKYHDSSSRLDNFGYGRAERHYDCLTIAELCALPIKDRVADDAVLFLWVPVPKLNECWPVIEAWGFQYKTAMVWDKERHNFGHYTSIRHEELLICTRGSCTPDVDKKFDSVQVIKRSTRHSEKPEEFRKIIDTLYPPGRRLELFAREKHKDWHCWGNEL